MTVADLLAGGGWYLVYIVVLGGLANGALLAYVLLCTARFMVREFDRRPPRPWAFYLAALCLGGWLWLALRVLGRGVP